MEELKSTIAIIVSVISIVATVLSVGFLWGRLVSSIEFIKSAWDKMEARLNTHETEINEQKVTINTMGARLSDIKTLTTSLVEMSRTQDSRLADIQRDMAVLAATKQEKSTK